MTYLSSYGQKWIFPKILKPDKNHCFIISLINSIDDNWKLTKAVLKYYKSIHWLHAKHNEILIYILGVYVFLLFFLNEAFLGSDNFSSTQKNEL